VDRELTRAELDELLPLFALDALDGEERAQVERYVARDETARAEVESLRDAIALLPPADVQAPASLWSTIEGSLGAPREHPAPPLRMVSSPASVPRPRGRRPGRVAAAVLAAAAIVAIAVLGVEVVRQQHRIDDLAAEMHGDPMRQQALAARASKDSHVTRLGATAGNGDAEIVMLPDGTGYFMDHDLPALAPGSTYQLWAKVGDPASPRMVSLGVLGADPDVVPFRLSAPAIMFEVTKEGAPGSTAPNESTVMMSGAVT
jgi:anti-sigma-K factor RskA